MAKTTLPETDPAEARDLIEAWQRPLFDFALRRLGNEADAADVTQEALIAILRDRGSLADASKERAWIYQVIRFAIYRHRRGAARYRARLVGGARERSTPTGAEQVEADDVKALLRRRLAELPEELREPIELRFLHGLTQVELSAVLDVPRGTLRARIDRGLSHLRQSLSTAGCAALAPALEAELRSLPLRRAPGELAAVIRGTVLKSAAAQGAQALAAGGILMKIKTLTIAAVLALAGFAGGAALTRGEAAATRRESRALAVEVERGRAERARLQSRLDTLEAERARAARAAAESERARVAAKAEHDRRSAELESSLEASRRRIAELDARPARPETREATDEGAPLVSLIEALEGLGRELRGDDDLEALPEEELAKLIPLFEQCKEDSQATAKAALRLIKLPRHRGLRWLLAKILGGAGDDSKRWPRADRDALNQALLELAFDGSFAERDRARLLGGLRFDEDSPNLMEAFRGLLEPACSERLNLRYAALRALASIPLPEARAYLRERLGAADEPAMAKVIILTELENSGAPAADASLAPLFGAPEVYLRQLAYSSAANRPASPALKAALEARVRSEVEADALSSLRAALIRHGDAATAAALEAVAADPNASLARRSFAQAAARSLRQRLAR